MSNDRVKSPWPCGASRGLRAVVIGVALARIASGGPPQVAGTTTVPPIDAAVEVPVIDGSAEPSEELLPLVWHDEPGTPVLEGPLAREGPHELPPPPHSYLPCLTPFGLRHSYTHGRNVGLGKPLVGTSWLNRPYSVGVELGTIWIMRSVHDHVSRDTDAFGGFWFGWDWDYYWGSELHFDWATPELVNSTQPDAARNDSLFAWSYDVMYYPLGDATFRPYWRMGIGNTKFDFPTDGGYRQDEWLLTFPLGVGLEYPLRRWLAARVEVTDHLSIGQHGVPTMNNLTFTLGLECRFGAKPRSYWPWNPSRHIR